jgi:glutathione S-transferase
MNAGALPILYSFRRCPYAMRARMAIAVSGVQIEHREILLRDKPAEMLTASPKGTVPVLVLPNGHVIDESLDVMRWALELNDPLGWLARVDHALIAANDGPFKAALDRYKYPHRYRLTDGVEHRQQGMGFLANLETRLCQKTYLYSDNIGFTDVAIFPFVRQFAATQSDWFYEQDLPKLHCWLDNKKSSALFEAIMVRLAPWRPGDAIVIFP